MTFKNDWKPVSFENDRKEYVYFFRRLTNDGALIKIGHSFSPKKRAFQLRLQFNSKIEILATIQVVGFKNALSLEKYFHNQFKDSRHSGEWFYETESLISTIQGIL